VKPVPANSGRTFGPHPPVAHRDVADPFRVAAQIVSGIGVLGAGVILRDGFDIRGLTTAETVRSHAPARSPPTRFFDRWASG
jgi:uncharacterized membrane protein YhiD involved in acid resistance